MPFLFNKKQKCVTFNGFKAFQVLCSVIKNKTTCIISDIALSLGHFASFISGHLQSGGVERTFTSDYKMKGFEMATMTRTIRLTQQRFSEQTPFFFNQWKVKTIKPQCTGQCSVH